MSSSSFTLAVPERAYLQVRGKDTKKFLQGVTTNDIESLQSHGGCLATLFLTTKGRVLSDALIYDITEEGTGKEGVPNLLIETHVSTHKDLAQFLSMYRLRSRLKIRSVPHYRTVISYGDSVSTGTLLSVVDPRHPCLGKRSVYKFSENDAASDPESCSVVSERDESMYSRYRMVHGLPEGLEIVGRVPLEANLDLLGYISFKKGCYVGQELIARTKHKGLVRKRLLPFIRTLRPESPRGVFTQLDPTVVQSILKTSTTAVAPLVPERIKVGSNIVSSSGQIAGEVVSLSTAQDMGLAKMTLKNVLTTDTSERFGIVNEEGKKIAIDVFVPQWWPEVDETTGKRLDDSSTF